MILALALLGCAEPSVDSATPAASACADPSLRAERAFDLLDGGADWQATQVYADMESAEVSGSGVAVEDVDGDGHPDILLPDKNGGRLYMGQGDRTWTDETEARWRIPEGSNNVTVSFADVDGDGDPDALSLGGGETMRLLLNDGGGVFTDATEGAGFSPQVRLSVAASWGDIDGDGDLDLAVASQPFCPHEPDEAIDDPAVCGIDVFRDPPGVLYENLGDGTFADISDRLGRRLVLLGFGHGVMLQDLDDDGDTDVYLVNDRLTQVSFASPNLVWFNDGAGGFSDVGPITGLGIAIEGMGLGIADLNDDGRPDLLVSGNQRLALLVSASGDRWIDEATARRISPIGDATRGAAWGNDLADLDNDGDMDAPVLFGWTPPTEFEGNPLAQPDALYVQDADGRFAQEAEAWGVADTGVGRGLVVVDLDGDGWLDLVKRPLYAPAQLYGARCGEGHWLSVGLEGEPPNTAGIGAVVELEAGGRLQRRWMTAGARGLFASRPPVVHFGLGEAPVVERLTVTWPDGTQTTLEEVEADAQVVVYR
ncbi:MAG: CRTAC1 family protein [Alphaproteobacteria bacterium]|nr:CRTAC1 family protein [Alphaproteobacteria bacterium]